MKPAHSENKATALIESSPLWENGGEIEACSALAIKVMGRLATILKALKGLHWPNHSEVVSCEAALFRPNTW